MASMVLLNERCVKYVVLGSKISLPPGYEVPAGYLLSWEHHFDRFQKKTQDSLIIHGKARIFLEGGILGTVRIESPDAKDFLEAIELMIRYMGGKISTFDLLPTTNSFVLGVANDATRLYQLVRGVFRLIRQKAGTAFLN